MFHTLTLRKDVNDHSALMDDGRIALFHNINHVLYRTSPSRANKNDLSEEEQILFSQRLQLFQDKYGILLGFWGIFSIPFSNRPGYILQSNFQKNNGYSDRFYKKTGHFMKPNLAISDPSKEVIETILRTEVNNNPKILDLVNRQPKNKGGIENDSNTCYISVILHILYRYRPFVYYIVNLNKASPIIGIIREHLNTLYLSENSICLMTLLDYLKHDPLTPDDCFNFLNQFIDIIDEENTCSSIKKLFTVSNNEVFPPQVKIDDFKLAKLLKLFQNFNTLPNMLILNIVSNKPSQFLDLNLLTRFTGSAVYDLSSIIIVTEINNSRHFKACAVIEGKVHLYNDEAINMIPSTIYKFKIPAKSRIVGLILLKRNTSRLNEIPNEMIESSNHAEIVLSDERSNLEKSTTAPKEAKEINSQSIFDDIIPSKIERDPTPLSTPMPCNFLPEDDVWYEDLFYDLIKIDQNRIKKIINIIVDNRLIESLTFYKRFLDLYLVAIDIRPLKFQLLYQLLINILQLPKNPNSNTLIFSYLANKCADTLTNEKIFLIYKLYDDRVVDPKFLIHTLNLMKITENNFSTFKLFIPEIFENTLMLGNLKNLYPNIDESMASHVKEIRKSVQNNKFMKVFLDDNIAELTNLLEKNPDLISSQVSVAEIKIISIFENNPSLTQICIFLNARNCVKFIIEHYPENMTILDANGNNYVHYIIISGNNHFFGLFSLDICDFCSDINALLYYNQEMVKIEYGTEYDGFRKLFPFIRGERNHQNMLTSKINTEHNIDKLNNKLFENKVEAYELIKRYSFLEGFKISKENGFNEKCVVIHCWKGKRKKNPNGRSNNTNCRFRLHLITHINGEAKIIVKNSIHNHELHPELFSHHFLPCKTIDLIKIMVGANIGVDQICRFVNNYEGTNLIPEQIRLVVKKEPRPDNETIELIDYVLLKNGKSFVYKDHKNVIQAVLTFTQDEIDNMKYAHVVFTDATSFPNKKSWKCHPITSLDGNFETVPIGVLFTGTFTKEVAKWFLETLFVKTELKNVIRTLITDEDSSIMSVIDDVSLSLKDVLNRLIAHILCAFHKKKNFKAALGVNGDSRNELIALWDAYSNSTNYNEAKQAYEELYNKASNNLKIYLKNHVEPLESRFIRSIVKQNFTLGHNTTNVAENYNYQSKRFLYCRYYTLLEMRCEIERIASKSKLKRRFREEHKFQSENHILNLFHIVLYDKPNMMIIQSINKSLRLEYQEEADNSIKLFDPVTETNEIISIHEEKILCSCGKTENMGLPCSHLIKYYDVNNLGFPLNAIDNRFIISSFPITLEQNYRNAFQLINENDLDTDVSYEIDHLEDIAESSHEEISPQDEPIHIRGMLLREATQVIDIVKNSKDATDAFMEAINSVKDRFLPSNGTEIDPSIGKGERKIKRIKHPAEK